MHLSSGTSRGALISILYTYRVKNAESICSIPIMKKMEVNYRDRYTATT